MGLRGAVRREARRLDVVRPGWASGIDRARLDMDDWDDCIHGQLFGHYSDLVRAVRRLEPRLVARIAAACYPRLVDVQRCRDLWLAEVDARAGEAA